MEFKAARTTEAWREDTSSAPSEGTTPSSTKAMVTLPVPESLLDTDQATLSPDAPLTHAAMAEYMNQILAVVGGVLKAVDGVRNEVDALRQHMMGSVAAVGEGVARLEKRQDALPQSLTDLIVNVTGIRQRRDRIATIGEDMMCAFNAEGHQGVVNSHNARGGVQASLSDVGQHIDAVLEERKDYISSATTATGEVKRKKDLPPLPQLLKGFPSDASMLLISKEVRAMAIIGTVLTSRVKMNAIASTVYGDLVMKISNTEIMREYVASALLSATGIDLRSLVEAGNSAGVEHTDDVDENDDHEPLQANRKRTTATAAKGPAKKARTTVTTAEEVTLEESSMHLDFSTVKKPLTLAMIHVAIREAMHWARIKANLVPLADQANKTKITSSCVISPVALVFYIDRICKHMGIHIDTPCMPQLRATSERIAKAANMSGFFGPDFSYEELVGRLLVPTENRLPITKTLKADIVTCEQDGDMPRGGQTAITSFLTPRTNQASNNQ